MWVNFPIRILIVSTFAPIVMAATGFKLIGFVPDVILVVVFILFLASRPDTIRFGWKIWLPFFILLVHTYWAIKSGRGIGSKSLLILFLEVWAFSYFLSNAGFDNKIPKLEKALAILFKIHVGYIFVEVLVRCAGGTSIYMAIIGCDAGRDVMCFRQMGAAEFLWALGFTNLTQIQAMWLGSQSASQVTVCAIIFFSMFFVGRSASINRSSYKRWFFASLLIYPTTATMTANFMLLGYFLMVFLFFPNSKISSSRIRIVGIVFLLFSAPLLWEVLTYRIYEMGDWAIYLGAGSFIWEAYNTLPLEQRLLGFGDIHTNILPQLEGYEWNTDEETGEQNFDTNFGLGALVFQTGLLFMLLYIVMFLKITLSTYFTVRKPIFRFINAYTPVVVFVTINLMLAIIAIVSMTHYLVAIETGGRHLLAFNLSVCICGTIFLRQRYIQDGIVAGTAISGRRAT